MGFRVVEYVVESEKIPESMDGYRMAVLADLHDCAVGRENQWLLAALRQAQPDRDVYKRQPHWGALVPADL